MKYLSVETVIKIQHLILGLPLRGRQVELVVLLVVLQRGLPPVPPPLVHESRAQERRPLLQRRGGHLQSELHWGHVQR